MTLKSGDRIFFDVTMSHMTLQVASKANLDNDSNCDPGGHPVVVDTVVLTGADVAVLLEELSCLAYSKTVVEEGRPGTSRLLVRTGAKFHGKTKLVCDSNEITMTQAERLMLSDAIRARVWRMFQ